jgi:GTP-binding protein
LNKADRPTSRPVQVENDLFDLFATLGASDEQADYPLLYASAKQGWAQPDPPSLPTASGSLNPSLVPTSTSMTPLFELIMSHVPAPVHLSRSGPFSMLTVQIEADPYVGMLYLGRIQSGTLRIGDTLLALNSEGQKVGEGKVKKIFGRRGLDRVEKDAAGAGEIISIAGVKCVNNGTGGGGGVNVTLVHPEGWGPEGPQALPVCRIRSLFASSMY